MNRGRHSFKLKREFVTHNSCCCDYSVFTYMWCSGIVNHKPPAMNRKEIRILLICTLHFHEMMTKSSPNPSIASGSNPVLPIKFRKVPSSSTLHTKHHTSSGLFTGLPQSFQLYISAFVSRGYHN